jgi:lysine-specific demethylase/histidyl-hydroxylase NO66
VEALTLLTGDAQVFREEIWASHPYRHRADPHELGKLLPLEAVDELVTSNAIRTPSLRLVKDGTVVPASTYTRKATIAGEPVTGLADPAKVLALFRDGTTIVLQGLHRSWPPLTRLVRALELELGHPCQANAYLTPPGAQGFATHQDTHDVFVFQTHGTKEWTVGNEEVLLEPGVSMYLPTGTPHSARSQRETSLHVTVGINRHTWRDVLAKVSRDVLDDSRYDVPLPAGYVDEPARLSALLADELASFAKAVEATDPAAVVADRVTEFLTSRPALVMGGLLDADQEITDDSVLERRAGAVCVLVPGADRLRLLLGDRELRVPARLEPALTFISEREAWRVAELPLDEQSRVVLARRLLREGLLRVRR